MSRKLKISEAIVHNQRTASDPERSVWVTANAGSGKTYVLTARVLRLLVGGVKPEEVLCLTYTKAAAAEMRGRVSERLAKWALLGEEDLLADLTALSGVRPTAGMLVRARSLFAHALETPGGLKIQTIHAFCESVLHRFPREAGVPFDFAVLEEHERDSMLLEAREEVLAAGLRGNEQAKAVETLFGLLSDFSIETAIIEALNQQRTLRPVLAQAPLAKRELRKLVGDVGTIDDVLAEIADGYGLDAADHAEILGLVRADPNGTDFVDRLSQIDPYQPDPEALLDAFLTQTDRTARKTLLKKATAVLIPAVAARVVAEGARLERLQLKLVQAELLARSNALLDVVGAIAAHYERSKRARSLLDFDDLVEKLGALLDNPALGPWVRYKLDAAISHILVDESQDTNPRAMGSGRRADRGVLLRRQQRRPASHIVCGGRPEAIDLFVPGRRPVGVRGSGRQIFFTARSAKVAMETVPLHHSFRTLPDVLGAVDKVFARPDLKRGVMEDMFLHETARAEPGGMVTLWPPIQDVEEPSDPDNWPIEAPDAMTKSAPRRVAERMAAEIRGWIETQRPLGPRGRAVRPEDVLILVQVRSVLFHEIIRALIREGVPTPGADRLAVTSHIGVLDLMALGDVLSNPADDLQLAALLRSPLFDVSEDDLLELANPRGKDDWLWTALEGSSIASVQAAYAQLTAWRNRLDFERPFNFYADVLYAGGGLKRMRARLGAEVDDVMAEFLDLALAHEQAAQPSLLGFLAELRSREVTIKRELAEGGSGVRVMTVHGAKGLEAPIVILADAAITERGRDRRSIYMRANPPLFIHASSEKTHAAESWEFKVEADAAQQAEYWRKLYVAMTRAEDELYVTGYLTRQGKVDGSWYEAIEQGLAAESARVLDAEGELAALVYPLERVPAAAVAQSAGEIAAAEPLVLPALPRRVARRMLRPSSIHEAVDPERALASRLEASLDPATARAAGTALHALLQHLGRLDHASWPVVAVKALAVLLPGAPELHAGLADKAIRILTRADLQPLFGPDSRAEVPFLVNGTEHGKPATFAGRFDRLVVGDENVIVLDYKSDGNAPVRADAVPKAHLTQLGIYALVAAQLFPGRAVEATILYTSPESLMNLPAKLLQAATSGFTIG